MRTPDYYYVIVGGGLAGLQLAARINEDIFFKGKKIAIIDPSEKTGNDKTWCFWEKSGGKWDSIIYNSWKKAAFISSNIYHEIDLGEYSYKMLRSRDFYQHIKEKLEKTPEITFINDKIDRIDQVTRSAIGEKSKYTATHFFDSRLPKNFQTDTKSTLIWQHFKGLLIETEEKIFNPKVFTMMDYRLPYENSTSFTYVLPVSETKALIEYTFFTPFLTEEKVYDEMLNKYIKEVLKISKWTVVESEIGMIPMTDYSFSEGSSPHVTKIGTGGGWVKASSGYSFKNTEKKVDRIIENIKSGYPPNHNLFNNKFRKYDAIFLDVLARRNDLGEKLFTKLYTRNDIDAIFRFLDEETTFSEDLKVMLSIYHPEFLKSFFRKI